VAAQKRPVITSFVTGSLSTLRGLVRVRRYNCYTVRSFRLRAPHFVIPPVRRSSRRGFLPITRKSSGELRPWSFSDRVIFTISLYLSLSARNYRAEYENDFRPNRYPVAATRKLGRGHPRAVDYSETSFFDLTRHSLINRPRSIFDFGVPPTIHTTARSVRFRNGPKMMAVVDDNDDAIDLT